MQEIPPNQPMYNQVWQPPAPPQTAQKSGDKSSIGLDANILSGLGYCLLILPCLIGWVLNIVLIFVEKESKFVRFHAIQAASLPLLYIGGYIAATFIPILLLPAFEVKSDIVLIIFSMLPLLFLLLCFVLLIVCAVMAFMGKKFKVPGIGHIAAMIVGL